MDKFELQKMIDSYNELRELCCKLAKEGQGERMGSDAWLCHALSESDITLEWSSDGIYCRGLTYTSQTWSHEPFAFTILWADLEGQGVLMPADH